MTHDERSWQPVAPAADAPPPVGAYTPCIRAGDFLYVSGQVPIDPRTGKVVGSDVTTQTRQVVENLRRALEPADATLDDVVSVTAYLTSTDYWTEFNEVYRTLFRPPYPTRTTVGVDLRGFLVEISAVAYVGTGL